MKILDIKNGRVGDIITTVGLVSKADIKRKSSGGDWLDLQIQDSTGSISCPVWDNVHNVYTRFLVNTIVKVSGSISNYNGENNIKLTSIEHEAGHIQDFVPNYGITEEQWKNFCDMSNISRPYCYYIERLMFESIDDSENPIRFCPASTCFRGNKVGGLLLHIMGVYDTVCAIYYKYVDRIQGSINLDRLLFEALIHDYCKIENYEWNGAIKWRDGSIIDHRVAILSKLDKIHYNLRNDLQIPEQEFEEIKYDLLSHHGEYGEFKPKSIYGWLLYLADMVDSKMQEYIDNGEAK